MSKNKNGQNLLVFLFIFIICENNLLMKKMIVFLVLVGLVTASLRFSNPKSQIFDVFGVDKVCFVSDKEFEGEFETVSCGDKFFNFCTFEQAKENALLLKESDAVQFYTDETSTDEILKTVHFQKMSSEMIDGIEIIYGYSPCYSDSVVLDGKKINVQVAKIDGEVVIGFPMILTGF